MVTLAAHRITPELSVSDFQKSRQFYVDILGFTVQFERPEKQFALLSLQGCELMIEAVNDVWFTGTLEHPYGRGINLQIDVDSVEPLANRLQQAGYPLFAPVQDNWYRKDDVLLGARELLVQDPDGFLLRFSEDIGTKSA
ncbi:MAG TPA: VOC family protein [bacterium]|nr:VOC family protein [bacterium]